jgi:hypothetical protein
MEKVCRICGSTDLAEPICLRETMFGTGETFPYQQCHDCKCLEIVERPASMDRYYPSTYYSYGITHPSFRNLIRNILAYYGPGWLFTGRDWWENPDRKSLREANIARSSRILDLDCGSGNFTASLKDIGLRNVIGADPFIPEDMVHPNGVRISAKKSRWVCRKSTRRPAIMITNESCRVMSLPRLPIGRSRSTRRNVAIS